MNLRRRYALLTSIFAISLMVSACSQKSPAKFNTTDITGAPFGKGFALPDHNGKPRTLEDFKGKVVLLSFGYTHCPDYCPTTLALWAQVLALLGEQSKDVQALFVTVDPQRDSAALLAQYVPAFHPSFIGLRGTPEQTKVAAAEYKVIFQKAEGKTPQTYTVDHSTGTYVHGKDGRIRLLIAHGTDAQKIAADLKVLLAQS